MDIKIINQKLGINSLNKAINDALSKGQYKTFRALIAYISWGGIGLIHEKLEKYYDTGNKVSLIIGVGDDGSEVDALRYLKQRLPKANIYVFHVPVASYKFHPKVYIFSNKKKSLLLIGSNNFTRGGLFCNSECCVKIEVENTKDKELFTSMNQLWESYADPKPPFFERNLHRLNDKLLAVYPKVPKRKLKTKSTPFKKIIDGIFPRIKMPLTPKTIFIKQYSKAKKIVSSSGKDGHKVLFLEILKETGADGTQVQIPIEVIKNYFNVLTDGHQTIEVKIEDNDVRPAVICHFPNNTHRISFTEIANLRRPFLMKFIRKDLNLYLVKFLKGRRYRKEITKCKKRTRSLAKRWRVNL